MKWFDGFLKNRHESLLQLALILGSLLGINYFTSQVILRFDWTENNRYTLSEASKDIAITVKDPITVKAYFSADLPPQLALAQQEFRNFLDEFRIYSDNNLEYEFINPNADLEGEQAAQQAGVQPLMLDVRERDQITQKRAYLGAVFIYGDKRETIPFIQPGAAMEYTIASTVKKLIVSEKPKIGVLQDYGAPPFNEMPQLISTLSQMYQVEPVGGLDTVSVNPELETLLLIRPQETLPSKALVGIDQFIMSGGKVIFALNRIDADLRYGRASIQNTGLETLLAEYRLPINGDLLRDLNSSNVSVRQQQGPFSFVNQIRYPFIPIITDYGEHPITEGLEGTSFPFISTLDITLADSTKNITVLARSSEKAGTDRGQFNLDPFREWQEFDFQEAHLPIVAIIEGTFKSAFATNDSIEVALDRSSKTALVVIGDGDFVVNGPQNQQQEQPQDNINLVVNAVDYLADDTGLIALRTKGVTSRPLDIIEDGTKTLLKYVNVFLPILLVIGYGFGRYQNNQRKRRKWSEQGV